MIILCSQPAYPSARVLVHSHALRLSSSSSSSISCRWAKRKMNAIEMRRITRDDGTKPEHTQWRNRNKRSRKEKRAELCVMASATAVAGAYTNWMKLFQSREHTQHSARVWCALKLKDYQQTTVYLRGWVCMCAEHALRLAPHATRNLLRYDRFSYFISSKLLRVQSLQSERRHPMHDNMK